MFTLYFKANWKMLQLVSSLILLNSYFSLNSKFTSRTVRQFAHRPPKFVPHSTTTDAMQDGSVIDRIPIEILEMLHDNYKGSQGLQILLPQLFSACRLIGTALRDGDFTADKTGTANPFGDQQLDVDIRADKVIFDCLKRSGVVHVAASEENPIEIDCGYQNHQNISRSYDIDSSTIETSLPSADQDKTDIQYNRNADNSKDVSTGTESNGYSIAFDPLDGSSIVDANFAVGTIAGIWPGKGLLNRRGKEQVASLICIYGPKVTVALALNSIATKNGKKICLELTMTTDRWTVSNQKFRISPSCSIFAPGNLKATADNADYKALISYWIDNRYTLRYSGGLVPDVYHILIKGQGVISNASSRRAKAKLRLLFEAAPIALIVEAAGGSSCVCATEILEQIDPVSLLEVEITDLDRRVGLCLGSTDEVSRFKRYLFTSSAYTRYFYTSEDNTRSYDSW